MQNSHDHFTPIFFIQFSLVGLLIIFLDDLDRFVHLWLLLPLILTCPLAVALLIFAALAISFTVTGRWRRLVSILLAPPSAFLLLIGMMKAGVTPYWIHLHFDKEDYISEAVHLPGLSGGAVFRVWDWGDTGGVATAVTTYTLVYDESEEIALPVNQRSFVWKHRAMASQNRITTGLQMDQADASYVLDVVRVDGHFFVVKETYN
jgi:hypothetical protein